jgi:glyoxylase-like metal-dependent hydrolase (beta-lactamase superfamily II)
VADTYTGDVQVGGPPDTRELPGLTITKIAVGEFDNNCYFLECQETGDVLLIDAAAEPDRLLETLAGRHLARIVTTHQHPDHWQGLEAMVKGTGAATTAHPLDADPLPVQPDDLVDDGGTVSFGNITLRAIHLVGHTPGSIALLYDANGALADRPHLFTGDCLFPGGPGNTRNDPEAFTTLMDGLEEKVFGPLPDSTWIYPGHGKDSTLGNERPHVQEWRERGW